MQCGRVMKVCWVFPNIPAVAYLLPDFPLGIFRPLFLVQLDIIPIFLSRIEQIYMIVNHDTIFATNLSLYIILFTSYGGAMPLLKRCSNSKAVTTLIIA